MSLVFCAICFDNPEAEGLAPPVQAKISGKDVDFPNPIIICSNVALLIFRIYCFAHPPLFYILNSFSFTFFSSSQVLIGFSYNVFLLISYS